MGRQWPAVILRREAGKAGQGGTTNFQRSRDLHNILKLGACLCFRGGGHNHISGDNPAARFRGSGVLAVLGTSALGIAGSGLNEPGATTCPADAVVLPTAFPGDLAVGGCRQRRAGHYHAGLGCPVVLSVLLAHANVDATGGERVAVLTRNISAGVAIVSAAIAADPAVG